jgi:hypothetical protein
VCDAVVAAGGAMAGAHVGLINPYPRIIAQDTTLKSKQKSAITKTRKLFTSWWMCRNVQLKKVFIFNDRENFTCSILFI